VSHRLTRAVGSTVIALATAIVVVAVAILPFLNPVWVGFEQGRADAATWTGYTPADLRSATDGVLADLVFGPPEFDVAVNGEAVLSPRERGHMRDVRGVFVAFGGLAVGSAIALAVTWRGARGGTPFWRAVRRGAVGLAVAVVAVGIVGAVAFDVAFEVFHRLFFAGGTYTFNPLTDRLVQLFPERFWFETSIAVGLLILILSGALAWAADRRLRDETPAMRAAPASLEGAR
jgi:integral membrane protein (TIGR01906 family)